MTKIPTKKEVKEAVQELQVVTQQFELAQQQRIRDLENFFVNGTVEDITTILEEAKKQKVEEMINYAKNHEKPVFDKNGEMIDTMIDMNPLVVNNLFFKSISPLASKIPTYNAEKLSLIYDYYLELITEVNDKIGVFPASISSFCKLAGLSTKELREYRKSVDLDMRNVVEKIYDEIGDSNLSMAQLGMAKSTPTVFKMKTQNEMVEKVTPNVNITLKENINTDRLNANLKKYKDFLK